MKGDLVNVVLIATLGRAATHWLPWRIAAKRADSPLAT